jgi:hypothetical protein
MVMVAIKALGGTNYVRAEKVVAVQSTPTGGSVVVMEGGVMVQSSELSKNVAERLASALLEPSDDPPVADRSATGRG